MITSYYVDERAPPRQPVQRRDESTVRERAKTGRGLSYALSRRSAVRAGLLGGAGLAAAALIGCQSATPAPPPAAPAASSGGAAKPKLLNEDILAINDPNSKYPFVDPQYDLPPKRGGILKGAWNYDLAAMDPTVSTSNTTLAVVNTVGDRLLDRAHGARINPLKTDVIPGLATSWELSPDGMTYTFKLTDKAKFHNKPPANGRAFTAEDVQKVYERYRTTGVSRSYFTTVDSMKVVNPTTFQIKLKKPHPDFLIPLASRELVTYAIEMVDSGQLAKNQDVIGTNGYILVSAERGGLQKFTKNKDYWRGDPYIEGIEWRAFPDQGGKDARLALYRTGQVDIGESIVATQREADAVKATNPDSIILSLPVVRGAHILGYQMKNPKWQDDRLRQALSLAYDRLAYNQIINDGVGVPFINFLPWTYVFDKIPTADVMGPWFRYDIAEAKKLLAAAGFENGFSFEFLRSPAYTIDASLSFTLDTLKKAGITVNAKTLDVTSFNTQWQSQSYPDTANGPGVGYVADTFYKEQVHTGASLNRWNISDSQLDEWSDQQSAELDPKKRKDLLRKIWDRMGQKMYHLDGPGSGGGGTVYPPYLHNYRINAVISWLSPGGDWGTYTYEAWMDK